MLSRALGPDARGPVPQRLPPVMQASQSQQSSGKAPLTLTPSKPAAPAASTLPEPAPGSEAESVPYAFRQAHLLAIQAGLPVHALSAQQGNDYHRAVATPCLLKPDGSDVQRSMCLMCMQSRCCSCCRRRGGLGAAQASRPFQAPRQAASGTSSAAAHHSGSQGSAAASSLAPRVRAFSFPFVTPWSH